MKNLLKFLLAGAVIAAISGCGRRSQEQVEQRVVNVRVLTVTESSNAGSKSYVGTVEPSKSTVISCRFPGTLTSLAVRQGQRIKKGDVVAEVESQTVTSTLESANATLEQARDGYERLAKVHESGSVAEVKMVEMETRLAQAEASAKAARQAYDDCTLKAPYNGTISDVYVDEGIEVSAATAIARIVDPSSEISFPVPESEVNGIMVGDPVRVVVPALADKGIECRITRKGVVASPLSHSYECTLKPVAEDAGLLPGMVCKVFLDRNPEGEVVIPASAVKTAEGGRYVWIAEDGKAKRTDVTIGGFSADGVIVTSGLNVGDKLIVEGSQKVSTGTPVSEVE